MKLTYVGMLPVLLLMAVGCRNAAPENLDATDAGKIPNQVVESTDSGLQRNNDCIFFHGELFSGTVLERDLTGAIISRQSFYRGKEEGWSEWYYPSGKINARRYFHAGEKDSVHTGWWESGQPRFVYHFRNGRYEGWFKEWYASGKRLKEVWYENGEEKRGSGWRENGKLYMSFEVRNGRMYGLVNPNLCYSLKNERGEYIRSVQK